MKKEELNDLEEIYYENSRYTVEYHIYGHYLEFFATKDESSCDTPEIEGTLKWDGCMNITQNEHYCGIYGAKEYLLLITSIYQKGLECMPNTDYSMEEKN